MFRSSKIEIVEDEIKLYLIDYPNDSYAKPLYADILRVSGKHKNANNIYQEVLIDAKSKKAIESAYIGLAKIEMINKNYDKSIKLIDKINKDFMDIREINTLNRIKVYSMVKEGIPFHRDNYTYTEKQILSMFPVYYELDKVLYGK